MRLVPSSRCGNGVGPHRFVDGDTVLCGGCAVPKWRIGRVTGDYYMVEPRRKRIAQQ
jgi:hypothetical protein